MVACQACAVPRGARVDESFGWFMHEQDTYSQLQLALSQRFHTIRYKCEAYQRCPGISFKHSRNQLQSLKQTVKNKSSCLAPDPGRYFLDTSEELVVPLNGGPVGYLYVSRGLIDQNQLTT